MWRTFKREQSAATSSTGAAALSRLDSDISEVVQNNSEKTKGRAEIDVHDEGRGLRVRTPRASPQIAAQAKSSRPVRILRSVLIANRGECALRMLRTASQMGLEVYGIYEEDDVSHVRAFERNKELSCFRVRSYSDPDEIIELIQKQNVDIIWPGWYDSKRPYAAQSLCNARAGLVASVLVALVLVALACVCSHTRTCGVCFLCLVVDLFPPTHLFIQSFALPGQGLSLGGRLIRGSHQ